MCTPRHPYQLWQEPFSQLGFLLWLVLSLATHRHHGDLDSVKGVGGQNGGGVRQITEFTDILERQGRAEGRAQEVEPEDSGISLGASCGQVTSTLWASVSCRQGWLSSLPPH